MGQKFDLGRKKSNSLDPAIVYRDSPVEYEDYEGADEFYPLIDVPRDLMGIKSFVMKCPFETINDERWFRCEVRRKKNKDIYECGFPDPDNPGQFLVICFARKRRSSMTTIKYVISTRESNLYEKMNGEGYLGQLHCNFQKTCCMLFLDCKGSKSYVNYGVITKNTNKDSPAYSYEACIPALEDGEPTEWISLKGETDALYLAFREIQKKGGRI